MADWRDITWADVLEAQPPELRAEVEHAVERFRAYRDYPSAWLPSDLPKLLRSAADAADRLHAAVGTFQETDPRAWGWIAAEIELHNPGWPLVDVLQEIVETMRVYLPSEVRAAGRPVEQDDPTAAARKVRRTAETVALWAERTAERLLQIGELYDDAPDRIEEDCARGENPTLRLVLNRLPVSLRDAAERNSRPPGKPPDRAERWLVLAMARAMRLHGASFDDVLLGDVFQHATGREMGTAYLSLARRHYHGERPAR